jgi:hypothetical protein
MKKVAVVLTVLAAGSFASSMAHADTDVFGTQQQIDGTYVLRRATTEQFNPVRGQSVLARPRPDFDPTPISIASFNLYPSLDIGEEYNSNIFAQQKLSDADAITNIDPAVSVLSDWGRHAVGISATGDINYYAVDNHQNFNSATIQAEGRYDIAEKTWFAGTAGYQRATELRGNPSTPTSQAEPSQFNLYTATAEANRGVGLLKAKLDYAVSGYEYSSVALINGGSASQSARDRVQNKLETELSYDYTENMKPYVKGGYNWRNYSTSGLRNSTGFNADIGTRMDWGGITTAQAYVGYSQQNYDNFTAGKNVNGIDFGADVLWNVTALTSIEGKATHSIEEATAGAASSYFLNGGSIILSHELRRDIILESTLSYEGLDYNGISQHDDYYYVSGGARYFINRNLHTDLTYGFERKATTQQDADFDQHVLMLRLGLQY